jgi:hypothetical protein
VIFSAQKCGGTHYLLGLLCSLEKILFDSAENKQNCSIPFSFKGKG